MNYHGIILFCLVYILHTSCEQKTEWDIHQGENYLIADCIITNELKQHELKLYWSVDQLNENPEGFSGAVLELSDGMNSVIFDEVAGEPGRYLSHIPFMASAGKIYRLTLSYHARSDTAYAIMTGVSPLEPFETNGSGEYFRYNFNPTAPAHMLELYYSWSSDPQYCDQYGACEASEVYYNLGNIDVEKIFAPDKQEVLFPHNTRIIRRKYSLSPDHQEFIRSLLLETEWRGGVFDTEQGNVPTNFQNGVRGWFAACNVVSDTVYFE
jgi:hypothetical protein